MKMLSNIKEKKKKIRISPPQFEEHHHIFKINGGFETFQKFAGYRKTKFLHCYVLGWGGEEE